MGKVVVVDDSEDIRATIRMILDLEGIELLEAADGEEALTLPVGGGDIVIVDGRLPGMSGLNLIDRFRQRGDDAPTLIMCSASIDEAEQKEAVARGAVAFVSKPFDVMDLLGLLLEHGAGPSR